MGDKKTGFPLKTEDFKGAALSMSCNFFLYFAALFHQMQKAIRNLRIVGISEGISFLVLLLIGMPLKYYFGMPGTVKVVGWIHGILFITYVIAVVLGIRAMRWNWFYVMIALAMAFIPFGTFALDKSLKKRQQELSGNRT